MVVQLALSSSPLQWPRISIIDAIKFKRKILFTDSEKAAAVMQEQSRNEEHRDLRRREALTVSVLFFSACMPSFLLQLPAHARQRRNTKNIPIDQYKTNGNGLKYFDVVEGNGPEATKGSTVLVHFDCVYKGLTAVSSRESKLLAGNRVIAQPYEFIVGSPPGRERKREFVDNPNGLFSAQAAPKPPKALYSITEGMHLGGQRTVIVTPEFGYGKKGMNEIPPDDSFELNIELLDVKPPKSLT